jgi:Cu-Zn family superoxide dismutase
MRVRLVPALLAVSLAGAVAAAHQAAATARAEIKGDKVSGTATLTEISARKSGAGDPKYPASDKLVEVTITLTGLAPGAHGVHLHEIGRCEAPFTSAGGHFDPGPNSNTDPDANHPYHMGDLPNIIADASGRATFTATTSRVTISSGPLSIFDADGTAIIIHANPDQGTTGAPKSGVSGGPRIACGVITK